MRIETGVLIQQAAIADNAREARTLFETAYGKFLEIQKRFPNQSTSLTRFLAGKRVRLSQRDVAMVVKTSTLVDLDGDKLWEFFGRHISPTAVDENGWTDLHWAAALNQPELARALIDFGAEFRAARHDD